MAASLALPWVAAWFATDFEAAALGGGGSGGGAAVEEESIRLLEEGEEGYEASGRVKIINGISAVDSVSNLRCSSVK